MGKSDYAITFKIFINVGFMPSVVVFIVNTTSHAQELKRRKSWDNFLASIYLYQTRSAIRKNYY